MAQGRSPVAVEGAEPDGRVQRGARNREAILDAVVELVREGDLRPTAEQVAERAGVGTRTVFRHFDDMEALHAEVSQRVERELAPILSEPPPAGSLRERACELVRRRSALYERIAPFRRSGAVHRWRSEFLRRQHAAGVGMLRGDLRRALPELERASSEVLEALDLVTSFEAWERLRTDQHLSRERTRATLERAILALLEPMLRAP
ncbi:MAG: TetR/AcrR family transcriptional regulator [Myxococcota bacterium]